MATQTLKIGSSVVIKATGKPGRIVDVVNGLYQVQGWHRPGELMAIDSSLRENKQKKVRKFSDQRRKLNAIYSILVAEIKRQPAICEGWGKIEGCTKKATQLHHKRGRRGFLLIASKYFGRQCDHCHKFCTKHSKEAVEMGLSMLINSTEVVCFTKKEIELIEKYNIRLPKLYKIDN